MKNLLIILLALSPFTGIAKGEKTVVESEGVYAQYQWKVSKEGIRELKVKFTNKSKSAVNVDLEVSFYENGILEESSNIAACLKKSFFANLFRPYHLVQTESKENDSFEVKLTEFKTVKVEECTETDD